MNKYYISRFFLRLIALLLTGICLTGFFPSTAAAAPSDDEVATIFRRRKASGGMVLAAKDGQIVYSFCFGYANKKTKEFITPDSYFKLASVSKLITAAAVMRLVDSG
ncbi:MAG: serine hydrolase, partial [Clostridia bacterium]|nr:serine hydrolase [Clostridia bacterium]